MPPVDIVDEWVHATSHENFRLIEREGFLKGNPCTDVYFDGKLSLPGAPRGTWFNANNYRRGTITKTPYPERSNDTTSQALAFQVSQLLDPQETYQLFNVSEILRQYLQVGTDHLGKKTCPTNRKDKFNLSTLVKNKFNLIILNCALRSPF